MKAVSWNSVMKQFDFILDEVGNRFVHCTCECGLSVGHENEVIAGQGF